VAGAITRVWGSGITISSDQGSVTFTVDSSDVTDGFQVGDVVDVSYSQNNATDVQYVEQDASGTVSAVSAGRITITSGGQRQTFAADPSQGMFDGISVGDQVDVVYHQSSGQLVADSVDDGS
jgi:Cu/Ag efflux protein CusF